MKNISENDVAWSNIVINSILQLFLSFPEMFHSYTEQNFIQFIQFLLYKKNTVSLNTP